MDDMKDMWICARSLGFVDPSECDSFRIDECDSVSDSERATLVSLFETSKNVAGEFLAKEGHLIAPFVFSLLQRAHTQTLMSAWENCLKQRQGVRRKWDGEVPSREDEDPFDVFHEWAAIAGDEQDVHTSTNVKSPRRRDARRRRRSHSYGTEVDARSRSSDVGDEDDAFFRHISFLNGDGGDGDDDGDDDGGAGGANDGYDENEESDDEAFAEYNRVLMDMLGAGHTHPQPTDTTNATNSFTMSVALDWCLYILSGGQPPPQMLEELTCMPGARSRCATKWNNAHTAYRCRNCGHTDNSCMCVDCFNPDDHKGHDFFLYQSTLGGCCDCGDPKAWRADGFCKLHTGEVLTEPASILPQPFRERAAILFSVLVRVLMSLLRQTWRLARFNDRTTFGDVSTSIPRRTR